MLFFFFFQAEDGIRDGHVTGVRRVLFRSWEIARQSEVRECPRLVGEAGRDDLVVRLDCDRFAAVLADRAREAGELRSEERRVGKEGRSWGAERRLGIEGGYRAARLE